MAETDWEELSGSAGSTVIARGVTAGQTPPNGGGDFVFGWNSLLGTEGAHGLELVQTNFHPLKNASDNATGGSIRAAIKRGISADAIDFAPMIFINLKGSATPPASAPGDVSDTAYLLGLEDSNPARVVLRKGSPLGGLRVVAGDSSILRVSSVAFNPDTWVHLRLDSIFNQNGDVVLKCFRNDLDANDVTAPSWEAIPGMSDFIDDALGVATGSLPLKGGFIGFAFQSRNLTRRSYLDHVEALRQL